MSEERVMSAEEFDEYTEQVGGPIETLLDPGVFAVLFDEPEHWELRWRDGTAYYVQVGLCFAPKEEE